MPDTKLFYTDGTAVKNIELPQYPNSAWNWIANPPEEEDAELYARVAAVYRVATMTADAVSRMPFAILNQRGDEVDKSDDYQNVTGLIPQPREMLRLWRMSLFFTNTAYSFIDGNGRRDRVLRYIAPDTMKPVVDPDYGLIAFKRRVNNKTLEYPIFENPLDNKIFWMHRLDHSTEVLPSENTEFKALINAAGVLYYSDTHIRAFFERGGIKPSLLKVAGVPNADDRKKIENVWTKVISGVYEFLGKVINADTMEVQTIGEGVDNLKDSNLHREAIEDVALAAGMPISLLLANSANYATANVEYTTWFNHSVIPWTEFMQDCMNELLFEPLGYRWDFRPEITNMGTEEEKERAGAYAALVASNVLPSVAAQMLGYELPPDYIEYTQLDEDYFAMLAQKTALTMVNSAAPEIESPEIDEPKPPKPNVQPDIERVEAPKSLGEPVELSLDQLRELDLWQQFAFRKLKRGESMQFPFVAKELDEATAALIRKRLPACKSEDDIRGAFDLSAKEEVKRGELLALADSLNRAVEAVMKPATKPVPREGEERDDFIERCIPIVLEDGTAEDQEQAAAICFSMWEERND